MQLRAPLAVTGLVLVAGGSAAATTLAMTGSGGTRTRTVTSSTAAVTTSANTAAATSGGGRTIAQIYKASAAGVVEISAVSSVDQAGPFGQGTATEVATGTGFVLDRQGHILTNDHVVADASRVTVSFSDGTTATATVSGEDASKDLAVLHVQVSASKLDPLPLGTSKSLVVGDAVLAIGNPFGYDRTVTAGIVSALGRTIKAPDGASITATIQTDAAINHGNSGGPLIDAEGRVVGITSQIADSGVDGNVGVGFAIPIEDATAELGRLEGSSQT